MSQKLNKHNDEHRVSEAVPLLVAGRMAAKWLIKKSIENIAYLTS